MSTDSPILSIAADRLLAVRMPDRDLQWHKSAAAVCKASLVAGEFALAKHLADDVGSPLRREGDFARIGLGLPLSPGAHPDATRAARALAGRDPWLIGSLKKSDPTRRAAELYWELQEGDLPAARSRVPRRMPGGDAIDWWRAISFLLEGQMEHAIYYARTAPGILGQWAETMDAARRGEIAQPSQFAYQAAVDKGDACLAARLFRAEYVENPEQGHVAATMGFCSEHRVEADRMSVTIADAFERALWRVRANLVQKGPGWEAVAQAAELPQSGAMGLAAPLAWLRAAVDWRRIGDHSRANLAIQRAGPRASSFPAELALARQGAEYAGPTVDEIHKVLVTEGVAATVKALGPLSDLPVSAAALIRVGRIAALESARFAAELGRVAHFPDAAVAANLLIMGNRSLSVAQMGRVLFSVPPQAAPPLLAHWFATTNANSSRLLAVALPAALANPHLMSALAVIGDAEVPERAAKAITTTGTPGDESRIALAEGCLLAGAPIPNGLLHEIWQKPGPWSEYAFRLVHRRSGPANPAADPRIAAARFGEVLAPSEPVWRAVMDRISALHHELELALDKFKASVPALLASARVAPLQAGPADYGFESGERRNLSSTEKAKKRDARKAQKAARKAGRKHR